MSDYKELREALEAGPTEGPWFVHQGPRNALPHIRNCVGVYVMDAAPRGSNAMSTTRQRRDAHFIAAANPTTIRRLLAELDALRK